MESRHVQTVALLIINARDERDRLVCEACGYVGCINNTRVKVYTPLSSGLIRNRQRYPII